MNELTFTKFIARQLRLVKEEWLHLKFNSAQSASAFKSALASTLALLIALSLGLPEPFWAGISALVVTQAHVGASFQRALHRIAGTLIAACLGILLVALFSNSIFLWIALFFIVSAFLYQSATSQYSYAWLIAAATLLMIDITAFIDPPHIIDTAVYRSVEIIIGSLTAWMVNWLCLPKYAKNQLQQHLLDTVVQFRQVYQFTTQEKPLAYQEFFQQYKKFVLFLDQSKTVLDLAISEKFFHHSNSTYDFLNRLLISLREAGELLLDNQRYVVEEKVPKGEQTACHDFFDCLVKYAENQTTKESLLDALERWHTQVNTQDSQDIYVIDSIPHLLKQALTTKPKKSSPPKILHKIALLHAIKGSICALIVPLIWIYFTLPGLDQIAISVVAILQIDPLATKNKGFSRILGCVVGSIIVYLVLGLNISHISIFLIVVFLVVFYLAYLHHGTQASTLGTQAAVVFLIGAFINLSPANSLELVFDRLTGIIAGVSSAILMMQYLWPLHPTQALFYKLAEIKTNVAHIIEQFFLKQTRGNLLDLFLPLRRTLKVLELIEHEETNRETQHLEIQISLNLKALYHDLFSLSLLFECFSSYLITPLMPENLWHHYEKIFVTLQQAFLEQDNSNALLKLQQHQEDHQKIVSPSELKFYQLLHQRVAQLLEDGIKTLSAIKMLA